MTALSSDNNALKALEGAGSFFLKAANKVHLHDHALAVVNGAVLLTFANVLLSHNKGNSEANKCEYNLSHYESFIHYYNN